MQGKAGLALTLVLVAVAFGAGWWLRPGTSQDQKSRSASPPAPSYVAREEFDRVTGDLQRETERRKKVEADLEAEKASRPPAPPTSEEEQAAADAAEAAKGPKFIYAPLEKGIRALDWVAVGDSLHAMPPLLEQLTVALETGGPMPANIGDIQRWNGPLVTQAFTAQKEGIPGANVNGSFSHPSLAANMVYAALQRSDAPLSEEQARSLGALGDRFSEEDARRLAGYPEETIEMRKLVEECELKDRFYAEVDAILTDTQRSILRPRGARGYLGADLFSSGIVWLTVSQPIPFQDHAQLEQALVGRLQQSYGIDAASLPVVQELVGRALGQLGSEYLSVPINDAVRKGRLMRIDRVRPAAKVVLALREEILRRIPLDPPHRKALTEDMIVPVPYLEVAGG